MSQRLQIVLPDPVATQLQQLAAAAGEPLATVAAQLVRDAVTVATKDGKLRTPKAPPVVSAAPTGRPRWLEPHGGDPAWRRGMWGAIVALHGRYPRHFEHLNTGWWTDESQAETLSALAVWRAEIDDAGQDPREELAYQRQLADYAHTLRQHGGGVDKTWQPGAPPEIWIAT